MNLAKSDLAYYYKQCLDGVEEVKRKAWEAYRSDDSSLKLKDKPFALKLIKECDEAKFSLLENGPSVMNLKSLEERLNKIDIPYTYITYTRLFCCRISVQFAALNNVSGFTVNRNNILLILLWMYLVKNRNLLTTVLKKIDKSYTCIAFFL